MIPIASLSFLHAVTARARRDLEDFLHDIERTRWLSHQQMEVGTVTSHDDLPRLVVRKRTLIEQSDDD